MRRCFVEQIRLRFANKLAPLFGVNPPWQRRGGRRLKVSKYDMRDRKEQAEQTAARNEIGNIQDFKKEAESLRHQSERQRDKIQHLVVSLEAANREATDLRIDLGDALDIAHRLLAKSYPSMPFLAEKKGNLFLLGRALLKKHGRLQESEEI